MSNSPSPATTYEVFMVPYRFRPWAGELLDRVALTPGSRLLDIACGTGIVARVAADRAGNDVAITGIDMNPAMIDVARATAIDEGKTIEWHVGTVDALPFPDQSFHVVTIQQGLQFFPNKPAALRECFRVLSPGGVIAIGIWSSLEKQGLQKAYAEAIERVTGSPAMHAPYGRMTREELETLLDEAGFTSTSVEEVTIDGTFDDPDAFVGLMVEGTSAGVPGMHGRSAEERAALATEVSALMADAVRASTHDGRLVSHSTALLAVAIRPMM
jgi:ubiquinone/menaquinone biosynthesis C-methylase UbiE